ncbi:nucleotidyl transferase AbiEii/AbiGii toxin family protein [Marinobacterium sp. BA1]|uniref:nucleotidyl transferase AbiEii/AbiGii toxin family protein n=1 Tax=Marinobacterium sp. BA1 TaxID=3138931 RepID=UPI0032E5AB1B
MLKLQSLPSKTKAVFELLRNREELSEFVLIGGTALSLQLNHRQSEDLDFWLPSKSLNRYGINKLIAHLKSTGHQTVLVTPASMISKARINGFDLLDSAQDWSIDGVKVTFFSRIDMAFSYFTQKKRMDQHEAKTAFDIMSADGVFAIC